MNIRMSGLDWQRTPIELRERLTFSRERAEAVSRALRDCPGVEGCVLIATCNRTEVYLSCTEGAQPDPSRLLCAAAGQDYGPFESVFQTRTGEDAAWHLMEVAGGLRSQIWGDDQIVTQVKAALSAARAAGTADSVLETLFRNAAAAGKEIKSRIRIVGVGRSAASQAVAALEQAAGTLAGKRALVIGNGEMGRLCARLLGEAGCAVTVTLRSYHHGETVVPAGCAVVPYEDRYRAMDGMDVLISATTSPHYTVTAEGLDPLEHPPKWMADLAIPRDIQPEAGQRPGRVLYNVDDLGAAADRAVPPQAAEIIEKYLGQLAQWENYRACLPALERVKQAVTARLLSTGLDGEESRDVVEQAVSRAVDLLSGGLRENLRPEDLERCAEKIEVHTAARLRRIRQEGDPFRFPLFLDLLGKRAVVVGGGPVACRRAGVLARFGAEVIVIAPTLETPAEGISWEKREYCPGDLAGAALAVAATDDRAVNRQVGEEARAVGIPVSVADRPEECTFFFPAICMGHGLVAGVVGRGDDHRLTARAAKAIRKTLEEL